MTGFSQPERRGLAQMQSDQPHLDADQLTAFSENSLTPREREQVLAHLAVCVSCREVVALTAPQPAAEPEPHLLPKPVFWRWPVLRWGSLAASAVIIVAAVSIGMHERTGKTDSVARMNSETAPTAAKVSEAAPAQQAADATKTHGTTGIKSAEVRYEKLPGDEKLTQKKESAESKLAASVEANQPAKGTALHGSLAGQDGLLAKQKLSPETSINGTTPVPAPSPAKIMTARAGPAPAEADVAAPVITGHNVTEASASVAPPPSPPIISGATETVEVRAAKPTAPEVEAMRAQIQKRKDAKSEYLRQQAAVGGPVAATNSIDLNDAASKRLLQWRTSGNTLQRSIDHGQTWETVLGDQQFQTVAVIGAEIWAGGPQGLLMHSSNNGQSWNRISPRANDQVLHGDIKSISFTDAQHGTVTTSTGEKWTTANGGASWQKP